MGKFVDLTGKTFGKLKVIEKAEKNKDNRIQWLCKCECGNTKLITGHNLSLGITKTCGCSRKTGHHVTHNLSNTRIYHIYYSMKARCNNKNNNFYKDYGGRGIKVCEEWLDKETGFINFYNWAMQNGYRDDLSIDRIDVNGNYEPSNCRWATPEIQSNNTRRNKYYTYKGETHTLKQWSKILKIDYKMLFARLNYYNRTLEQCFTDKKYSKHVSIMQFGLDGNFIKKWENMKDAVDFYKNGNICQCCKNKRKTAAGYIWRYADEVES